MNSTQQLESRKNGKAKYSPEQLEALDRLYTECSPPNSLKWQQLLQKYPILSNIEPKLITVWFQNRRTSEKQKKMFSALRTANQKLTGMNKLLMEENARLQKHFSILESDNGFLRNRIHTTSVATNSQHQYNLLPHQRDANNPAVLRAIAVETLAEFRSKVTGTVFKWVPMPSPDSGEFIAVSHYYRGVAARACRFVDLEPHKVAEILKDRLSWYRDCRSVDVHEKISTDDNNGGTIELMHMKTYAPTTLPSACDFWTLRYTTVVENDLVICEWSLTPSTRGPTGPPTQNFLRAEMLPSGYLIRPCEGGSTIYIVDHIDMDASRVPAVLRPLYKSPKFLAQKMTIAALHHVRLIKLKSCHEIPYGGGRQLHVLRILSQRLSRGFNDAVNGFADDGWYVKEGFQDVVVAINCSPNKPIGSLSPSSNPSFPTSSGIICAKASILLQNIPPRSMVMYLREHRSVWDYTVKTYSAASLRAGSYAGFLNSQVILPPAHTLEHEEFLEFVKLERHFSQDGVEKPGDFHILQLCSGLDESSLGACAQLVFAPIDESSFSENTPLLPCGFRIISLDSKTENTGSAGRATQAVSDSSDPNLYSNTRSILTIAFQFTYENNLHDSIEMAWKYVRSVVASVNLVAAQIGSQIEPSQFPGASPEDDVVASRCFPNFL